MSYLLLLLIPGAMFLTVPLLANVLSPGPFMPLARGHNQKGAASFRGNVR